MMSWVWFKGRLCQTQRLKLDSATRHLLQLFGVSRPLYCDFGGGVIDVPQILGCEFDGGCPDVLLQAMQLCGAWNGDDPRLLSQQPGKCDLSGRCLLLLCDAAKQIDRGLIGLESLRCEARQSAAEVGAVKGRVFVDLAGEEAFAQRAVRDKSDAEFLKGRYHFRFRLSPPSASIRSGVPCLAQPRARGESFALPLPKVRSASPYQKAGFKAPSF